MEKRWIKFVSLAVIGLVSFMANGQQSSTSASATVKDTISPGTLIQAEIASAIDAKKAHAGDVFRAKLWEDVLNGNKVVLPQKTILVGHVVEAQPRSKTSPDSKLTIAIDKAILKNGSELPLRGVVERIELSLMAAAAQEDTNAGMGQARNVGSTTNIAMPNSQMPGEGQVQRDKIGPTGVQDPNIVTEGDPAGALTVISSTIKADVKIREHSTLDVRITHSGE